jgi:hypothetical protein
LKVAFLALGCTGESDLWFLLLEHVDDLPVGDITRLVHILDDDSLFVANAALAFGHQGVTSIVGFTHVAVYPAPSFLALAVLALPWSPIAAVRQGTA